MRYIIFVIDGPGNPASPNEMQNIDAFNEKLQKGGHLIMAAGIREASAATLIDNRSHRNQVQAGSLFTAPEHFSGFWIIQADSEEQAREFALEGSLACHRKVELRPFIQ